MRGGINGVAGHLLLKPTTSVAVRTIRAKREGHGRPGRAHTGEAILEPCEHAARRVLNCRPLLKFFFLLQRMSDRG